MNFVAKATSADQKEVNWHAQSKTTTEALTKAITTANPVDEAFADSFCGPGAAH